MGSDQGKDTVLIVDDAVENLDILTGILGSDYNIRAAISGEQALKILQKVHPDMILLDITMPGMDGYEVIQAIKSDESTKEIPVIFVSARGEVSDEAKGFDLGASDYIIKPLSPPIIKARVATQITLYKQKRELRKRNDEMAKAIRVLENKLSRFAPQGGQLLRPSQDKTPHQKVDQSYFLDDHKLDLAELIEDIESNVSLILLNRNLEKEYLNRVGSKFLRYAQILMLYPLVKRLGEGMYDYAKALTQDEIHLAAENTEFVLGCLESLIFTLERWHTQIFNDELEDPNIFDNSMLADMQTITMALNNDYEETEEIEFF